MKPTLFSIVFKNGQKNQEVICPGTSLEDARNYTNNLLNELGHTDWSYVSGTPIRAAIFVSGSGTVVPLAKGATA